MKILFRCLLLVSLSFATMGASAQSPVKNAGNVKSASVNGQQIDLVTDNAWAQVTVYSPTVIRVRLDKQALKPDFSYAVIAQPEKTNAQILQDEKQISINTDSLRAIITKTPFAVTFYTKDGQVISQDEAGFGTQWVSEAVTTYKHMQDGERFIGLGEKVGDLNRRGNGFTNWNSDTFGYSIDRDPIYSTIPFYIGIHHSLNYGIFLDNTYQSDFNFGASNNRFSSFGARGGEMNYYFIYHKRLADIITSYTALTGRMKMPPMWSLGYQQNRYSYYPEAEVFHIANTLREKQIPADGITLDIHYMDKYKVFTWDKLRFKDPKGMTDKLKQLGFKLTLIVDPGVKVEKGYDTYESGRKANVFARYPDSTNYTGEVWPGWCHFPDFTNPKGRNWWGNEIKKYADAGVSGIWNDMNEIATWGQKTPDNIIFDYEGRKASNLEAHNVYALEMVRASYDGARAGMGKRPFILTRAGYAGLQRYSAIWTGDNRAEDSHMLLGVRLLNSLGLSGVPFTGMDIGGFTGNGTPSLFARWVQIGAFNPYMRNHTAVNTKSAEPWSFGEEVLEISRNYISLRYKLMPYLYSTFYEATQNGKPVMRSLAIDYTYDENVYNTAFQNQYLFGHAFLVAPFEGGAQYGKVYFPAGKWYNLYNDDVQQGAQKVNIDVQMSKLPVWVKESSIVPMQSLVQSTAHQPTDTLRVHIYQGNVNNNFVYYEDDGESFGNETGDFYKRQISYDAAKHNITFGKVDGNRKSKFNYIKLILHGFTGKVKLNGKGQKLIDDVSAMLVPISKFDPQGAANQLEGAKVKSVVVENGSGAFTVSY